MSEQQEEYFVYQVNIDGEGVYVTAWEHLAQVRAATHHRNGIQTNKPVQVEVQSVKVEKSTYQTYLSMSMR